MTQTQHESKTKLLDAALHVIRAKGYAATTIDDICHKAGVTKGSFFHHFKSKDELALAAASYWGTMTDGFFAAAPYRKLQDPLQRLLGYVDFRGELLQGELPDYTCLLGTLVQETYATHPDIRAACDQGMSSHIAELTRDVEAAKSLYAPKAQWNAESVGYFIQAVLQGGFIFAKAKQNPDVVRESLAHLRRYLEALFSQPRQTNRKGEINMKCLIFVKASKDSEKGTMPDPELLAAMGKYNEELFKAGIMKGGGGLKPTSHGKRVRFSGAQRTVINGPFVPTEEQVAGYWLWEVKSIDEAVEWLKRCPNPMLVDSDIEIRPEFEASDFAG